MPVRNTLVNYQAAQFWLNLAQWASILIIGLYVAWSNRRRATRTDIEDLQKGQTELSIEFKTIKNNINEALSVKQVALDNAHRSDLIEEKLNHVPTSKDMIHLERQINEVAGNVEGIANRITGIAEATDLMNEYLINNGGKT